MCVSGLGGAEAKNTAMAIFGLRVLRIAYATSSAKCTLCLASGKFFAWTGCLWHGVSSLEFKAGGRGGGLR